MQDHPGAADYWMDVAGEHLEFIQVRIDTSTLSCERLAWTWPSRVKARLSDYSCLVSDQYPCAHVSVSSCSSSKTRACREPVHPFSVTFTREMAIFEEQ